MINALCSHAEIVIFVLLSLSTTMLTLVLWWMRKYILDQDEWKKSITARLEKALDQHDDCQKQLPEKYVIKTDFMQFMQMRSAEHGLINSRLLSLENQQSALISKIDIFMDDIKIKQDRLSNTFLAKEHEISKRIDNLVMNHRSME